MYEVLRTNTGELAYTVYLHDTAKGGADAQKGVSPTPSSLVGEAGDTGDVIHDLRDEVTSLEDALSQMVTSSKMPFCFAQCGRLPSE